MSVTAGAATTSINAKVVTGGKINGTLKKASNGTAVKTLCATAYDSAGQIAGSDSTNGQGEYSIDQLPTGNYTVQFTDNCGSQNDWAQVWYPNAALESNATSVSVTAGQTTYRISDVSINPGGDISGTVSNSQGSLAGICVTVFDSTQSDVASGVSGQSGAYLIKNLPTGDYTVEFASGCGNIGSYSTQWYSGQTSQQHGNSVSVTEGSVTDNIDATMD